MPKRPLLPYEPTSETGAIMTSKGLPGAYYYHREAGLSRDDAAQRAMQSSSLQPGYLFYRSVGYSKRQAFERALEDRLARDDMAEYARWKSHHAPRPRRSRTRHSR